MNKRQNLKIAQVHPAIAILRRVHAAQIVVVVLVQVVQVHHQTAQVQIARRRKAGKDNNWQENNEEKIEPKK